MQAAIDIGSNTVRMLIGDCHQGRIVPHSYHREITRLAGAISKQGILAGASMDRTLSALKEFNQIIKPQSISHVRAVGTAALRQARNQQDFTDQVFAAIGLKIEIIDGAEEALLATRGVLSVIDPIPDSTIIVDIGGGSTELVCVIDERIQFRQSYPLGVVLLSEKYISSAARQQPIDGVIAQFNEGLNQRGLSGRQYQLIGTAGTITTLAAMHLRLKNYDATLINNHELSIDWLKKIKLKLELLSIPQREALSGMEKGRGDLILPGLQILLTLSRSFNQTNIKVADSGLLEGILLSADPLE